MATSTTQTSDGLKLRTQSNRRYVVFLVSDDSRVMVHKRTDNQEKGQSIYGDLVRRGYSLRVILVDTADKVIVRDSADWGI